MTAHFNKASETDLGPLTAQALEACEVVFGQADLQKLAAAALMFGFNKDTSILGRASIKDAAEFLPSVAPHAAMSLEHVAGHVTGNKIRRFGP